MSFPKTIGPKYSYTPDGASLIAVFRSDIESASRPGHQTGRIAWQRTSEALRADQSLVEHYIGIGSLH